MALSLLWLIKKYLRHKKYQYQTVCRVNNMSFFPEIL